MSTCDQFELDLVKNMIKVRLELDQDFNSNSTQILISLVEQGYNSYDLLKNYFALSCRFGYTNFLTDDFDSSKTPLVCY